MPFSFTRRVIVNLLEGTILVILIAAAGYVSIGRILVANIGKFRVDIEKSLSRRLNADVYIGKISGGWIYLDPRISIDDLVIGSATRPAIRIGHASARLDSLASLRELDPVVRNLDVAGLSLTASQRADGGWQIEGMPRGKGKPFNPGLLLDSVRYLRGVDIRRLNIEVDARHRHYHIANQPDKPLKLVQEGIEKKFTMPLRITHAGSTDISHFELLGRYSGDPRNMSEFTANAYLRLPQIDVTDFLPGKIGGVDLGKIDFRGQFWLDCNHGGFEMRGLPVISEISIRHKGKPLTVVRNLTASLAAGTWGPGDWQVHMAGITAQIGNESWRGKSVDLALNHAPQGWSWGAQLPDLNVGQISRMVANIGKSGGYLDKRSLDVLGSMKPGGRLTDVFVESASENSGPKLTARVDHVHFNSWRRSPGISDLNGFVSLTPSHGYVDVDNTGRFTVTSSIFPEPWSLSRASGRLNYERSPGHMHLISGLIHLSSGDMKASARVSLNMPADPTKRTWALEIGIRHMALLDVHKYLPVTLADNLRTWVHRALQGGQAVESGLLFHGTIGKDLPKTSKNYELFFKAKDVTFDYDPHWPQINHLAATVYIGDWGVESDDVSGVIYSSAVTDGHVSVPVIKDEPANTVLVHARMDGPIADGIKLLTQTPVAKATNDFARDWSGTGKLEGVVALNIPIGDRAGQPAGVDVGINLPNDDIVMAGYKLKVSNLEGGFRFSNDTGLTSKGFTAALFNHRVHGSIETHAEHSGRAIDLNLAGKVDIEDVYKWSGQTLLSRASGTTDYAAQLHIPLGAGKDARSWVQVKSNLAGVTIDLPPPMAKNAAELEPLVYRQTFLHPGYRVDLTLGRRTRASLVTKDGIVSGGKLQFGESPIGNVSYDKVRVTGHLDHVHYAQWEKVTRYLDNKSKVSLTSAAANTLDYVDVNIGDLDAFGMSLADAHVHITRQKGAWKVQLKNRELAGRILVPDDTSKPLDVGLDYLRYKSAKGKAAGDPLSGVKPSGLVPVDFSTGQLALNGVDYGSWSFKFRPNKTGAMVDDLKARVKGLSIQPDSEIEWNTAGSEARTTFKGTIKVHDLAKALKAWGIASSIEGKDFVFDADVAWPGSPANVGLYRMQGMLKLKQGQGRFVQADAGGGALKLLGIFDFASLAKRFRLDFSDIAKKGFSFSEIKGSAKLNKGVLNVVSPVEITGPSSTLKLGGTVNLKTGRLDSDLVITLPVARNLPWYAAYSAIVTGPLAGAGVWLAQKIFGNQINQMSSAKYKISGTIDKPSIEFDSIFNDTVRESSAEPESLKQSPGPNAQPTKKTAKEPDK